MKQEEQESKEKGSGYQTQGQLSSSPIIITHDTHMIYEIPQPSIQQVKQRQTITLYTLLIKMKTEWMLKRPKCD